jgi:hypothetical protein
VLDNATMQTDPPKADPSKRKRRWFQFNLWMLFVVTTIVAVQCAVCLPTLSDWQGRSEYREPMRRSEVGSHKNLAIKVHWPPR